MALPHLTQDEADLLLQNVGRPRRFYTSFRRNTPGHVRPRPYLVLLASQRQVRVANVRTRVKLAHRAAETDPAALDDVGAVGNQPGEMQVLLGDEHAGALLLHR